MWKLIANNSGTVCSEKEKILNIRYYQIAVLNLSELTTGIMDKVFNCVWFDV